MWSRCGVGTRLLLLFFAGIVGMQLFRRRSPKVVSRLMSTIDFRLKLLHRSAPRQK